MPATATAPAPVNALMEQMTVHRNRARNSLDMIDLDELDHKDLQLREATDPDTVAEYAAAYLSGETIPPIVVFQDDKHTYLADGHHRVAAARKAKLTEIQAIVKQGDRRAATLYAASCNGQHGLRLTNADKRKIVSTLLADAEWKAWSNRELARVSRTSEALVRLVRKDVHAEVSEITRKDGTKQQARNAKAKQPRQTSLLDPCADERATVDATWPRMRELPGSAHLHETKCRILSAMYHYVQSAEPGTDPAKCYQPRRVIEQHIGCPVDVHAGQLAAAGAIDRADKDCFEITDATYLAIDAILRPVKPVEVPSTQPAEIFTNLIPWPEIAARLRIAVASSGISANAYATKHNLPYLALVRTIAEGVEPSDDGVAETLYDHGATLPSVKQHVEAVAAETVTVGPEEITAPADPTPSPEVPAAAPSGRVITQPAHGLKEGDLVETGGKTFSRPLGLRRLDKQREILALRLRAGKLAWQGSDDDLFLLARIAGVPSAPTAWIDAARATARVDFLSALARECADRVQTGETMNARKWPQLAELCRLWSLDHQAIEIEAERAVPA